MPDLSRPIPTPSHDAKMTMIFRNAATSLQGSESPTYQSLSNIKRFRAPLSQARTIKFGSTCQDGAMVSSGLGSPSKMSRVLGEPYEPDWASSEVSRHQASGVGPQYPTPTPLTKAGRATLGTLTNECLAAATGFGSMCLDNTPRVGSVSLPSQVEDEGKEPISSGFATPIAPTPNSVENPANVKYPMLGNWPSLQSSSNASSLSSDSDDLHSTHGVPFTLPFSHSGAQEAARSDIDSWLNGIVEATSISTSGSPKQCYGTKGLPVNDASFSQSIEPHISSPVRPQATPPKLRQDLQSPPKASSDKENIGPTNSSSPTPSPTQYLQIRPPIRFRQTSTQPTLQHQHSKAPPLAHSLTPQSHLTLTPKHKRARVDAACGANKVPTARRDFTIHEDRVAEALAQLSPEVERHRKGRGPKRERCISYWDDDILQSSSQCVPMDVGGNGETIGRGKGKQVLGESKQMAELTTEKPFVKEAKSASFQFKA
ncbi:hypothetical protein IMSHALPRED_009095 [Imshaugia aleurites]|uniref:Uncharacterized protein n=1 Tax=Imshaugia aleurites TaxID=172621 RepID=A0A8H3IYQ3_9LECA|nr:hypothetical protein IMSHALPRED_009095 [Imshaugia aleurites]